MPLPIAIYRYHRREEELLAAKIERVTRRHQEQQQQRVEALCKKETNCQNYKWKENFS